MRSHHEGIIPVSDTSRSVSLTTLPSFAAMSAFIERAVPGRSPTIRRVHQQILEFCASPTARAVLLRGPIGAGKSTIARVIALLKRVAVLSPSAAKEMLEVARFDGPNQIDLRYISSWYVELALTGLVESLAATQLFGSVEGAYSDAPDRAGVFEAASLGRVGRKGQVSIGARVTKGVVFLDEIGDLPADLQAKLLPVLSGGVFYRIGAEGKEDAELQFRGVTITATWKDLGGGRLRPDLLSRIAPYVIDLPGVEDRIDDFDLLLDGVQDAMIRIIRSNIEEICTTDPAIDRGYWRGRMEALTPIVQADRDFLRQVAWGVRANLRGLATAVEQMLSTGADAKAVVANLPTFHSAQPEAREEESLFRRLLARDPTGDGLGAHVRTIERERRRSLRTKLQSDRGSLSQLSDALGIEPERLRLQIRDIDRDRRGGEDG
jgi:DNA-binding NtrC family response regulator